MRQDYCDDETLNRLAQMMASADSSASNMIDTLLGRYPNDPRLGFLHASLLVSSGQLVAAHAAFARTLQLAPDFALARYQYGFFLLTSGEVDRALEVWGPLDQLPDGNYLRHALEGMRSLVRDDFASMHRHFSLAIQTNTENEPLNHDLRLLMTQISAATQAHAAEAEPLGSSLTVEPSGSPTPAENDQSISEASLLLQQFKSRLH